MTANLIQDELYMPSQSFGGALAQLEPGQCRELFPRVRLDHVGMHIDSAQGRGKIHLCAPFTNGRTKKARAEA